MNATPRLPAWIAVDLAVLLFGALVGAALGRNSPGLFAVEAPQWIGHEEAYADFKLILFNNLMVMGLAMFGAISFGVISFAVVLWNGLFLGFNIPAISRLTESHLGYVAVYLPIEVFGLCIAAAVGQTIGLNLCRSLYGQASGAETPWFEVSTYALISLLFTVVAAGIETSVKILRNFGA